MTIPTEQLIPLRADDHDILRVTNTRVPFDNLVHEFERGATPEEIVAAYPTVSLADVYTLIGYYLRNRAELDEYLRKNRTATAGAIEQGRQQQAGLRERLLARLNAQENLGAPVPGG
jgi:uncharacterized protein (DUF433 family)